MFQQNVVVCDSGHYGKNCSAQCSINCNISNRCDRVTGKCEGGCKPGWTGFHCDQGKHVRCFSYMVRQWPNVLHFFLFISKNETARS